MIEADERGGIDPAVIKVEKIDLFHVALPTRRTHKWKGLTGSIGGYMLGA